jgi:hypothetical protein
MIVKRIQPKESLIKNSSGSENNFININATAITIFLTLLFTTLYFFGYSFSLGYFEGCGVDADLFGRAADVYAAKSFIAVLLAFGLIEADTFNKVAFGLIAFAVFLAVSAWVMKRLQQKSATQIERLLISFESKQAIDLEAKERIKSLFAGLVSGLSPAIVFMALIYALILAYLPAWMGLAIAKQHIQQSKAIDCTTKKIQESPTGDMRFLPCVEIKTPDSIISQGVLLAASTNAVLIVNKQGVEVVMLKDGYKLVRLFSI